MTETRHNPSIYTVGGTVQANQNGVYIPRKADEELLGLCRENKFVYILTSRQMGKSSLMVRTAEQLADEEIQTVVIDLTQVGVQVTAEQWYLGLLTIIEGTLMLDTDVVQWWQERSHIGFTQRLTSFFQEVLLKEVASLIVIFVDEIDTTLSLDFTDDFFAAIRFLYVVRASDAEFQRLSFVLIGVATPGDLIRDPKRTPFNIGQRLDVTDFTFEEAKPLAQGLGLSTQSAQQVLKWMLEWTGGQPYLSQRLCCIISQQDKKSWSKADVDGLVSSTFLGAMSEQDNNLQFVRDMLTKRAPDKEGVLTTYREIRRGKLILDEEQSIVKSHLKLSGVVRREQNVLKVRNRIYQQVFDFKWLNQHLPLNLRDTWERLKPAFPVIGGLLTGVMVLVAGVAKWESHKASISEIQTMTKSSELVFASNNTLDALIEAITAKEKLKIVGTVDANIQDRLESVLRQATYTVVEHNRLIHSEKVNAVAFSPNGQLIATASDDYTVKLWKLDGTFLTTLKEHSGTVYKVAFSPQGNIIATASGDKTVKLWKLDGTLLTTLNGHSGAVYGVAFSPQGNIIATASGDKTVKLWRASDGTLLTTLNGHTDRVTGVTFSPVCLRHACGERVASPQGFGQLIASTSRDKTIKLWKLDGTLLTTLKGHSDVVSAVAFSPDGQMLATASWDKTVKLWKRDGTLLTTLNNPSGRVYGLAFSPVRVASPQGFGDTIASAGWDRTIKLWKTDGTLLTTLSGHSDTVWGVAFSPDGKTIASASSDKTVKLWNWKRDNILLTTLNGHSGAVYGVAFSPEGEIIATAGDDNTVKLWKPDGTFLTTLKGHNAGVRAVTFSPVRVASPQGFGQTIASASRDKTIKLWKLDGESALQEGIPRAGSGEPRSRSVPVRHGAVALAIGHRGTLLTTLNDSGAVYAVAFSPDGKIIASASDDNTVKLQKPDGTLLTTLRHDNEVWGVAFSPDGQTIASASRDKTVKLWKRDGSLVTTLNGHNRGVGGVAFSPDGQTIATGSQDKTVKLWKRDGTLLTTFKGHNRGVWGVAFSPDGKMIASASDDKTVKLWKRDGTLLTTLNGHNRTVWKVAFSPDGKTIASTSDDKTVILWNLDRVLDTDKVVSYACDWVKDYLRTNAQQQQSVSGYSVQEASRFCSGIKPQ